MNIQKIVEILGLDLDVKSLEISTMNALKDASNSELSFVANAKYVKDIQNTKAAVVLVDEANKEHVPEGCIALVVDNPYLEVATLSKYFAPSIEDYDAKEAVIGEGSVVSKTAELANGCIIGKNCTILAGVYIGSKCVIGDNTILYPNVVVYRDCHIGNNCMIHSNTTIGADGFGFATNKLGEHKKIYQNGNVIIEDDVEIGCNTCVDRAVFGSTLIKKGVRIDNLVQIGHNCEIGEYSVFVAQSGSAGSTKLGRNVVVGGQSAFAGHLDIAPFSTFAARSGITKNITESGKTFAGFPLMEHKLWLKLQIKIARLLK